MSCYWMVWKQSVVHQHRKSSPSTSLLLNLKNNWKKNDRHDGLIHMDPYKDQVSGGVVLWWSKISISLSTWVVRKSRFYRVVKRKKLGLNLITDSGKHPPSGLQRAGWSTDVIVYKGSRGDFNPALVTSNRVFIKKSEKRVFVIACGLISFI